MAVTKGFKFKLIASRRARPLLWHRSREKRCAGPNPRSALAAKRMTTKYGVHIARSTDADDERSELIGPFATEESARLWIARHPIQNARCNVMRVSRVEPWEWTKP
jgi:hypothetical protein